MRIINWIFGKKDGLQQKSRKELICLVESMEKETASCKADFQHKLSTAAERIENICWSKTAPPLAMNQFDEADPFFRLFSAIELLQTNNLDKLTDQNGQSTKLDPRVNLKLQAMNDHLTTLSETKNALKVKNQELQKLNEELDKFVYSASHDLRAPIASILGLINIALKEQSTEVLNEYLHHMAQSANKLDNLIRDIINYSWNSRMELVPENIDFQSLIREELENFSYFPGFEKIHKKITIKQGNSFYADRSRFKIVVHNIIANAIKFSKSDGEAYLIVNVDATENFAKIDIADNGEGILTEHVDHIFEMFYKANPHKSGSGLGLYIAKEALVKLNGSISVQSCPDDGTWFSISVPNMLENAVLGELPSPPVSIREQTFDTFLSN